MNLTTVAPLELVKNAVNITSNMQILEANVLQSTVNGTGRDIAAYVSRIGTKIFQ